MILCLCLAVCLSVTSRCSIEMDEVVFCMLLSTYPTPCFKEIQVSTKIRALLSETLSQTPDLERAGQLATADTC